MAQYLYRIQPTRLEMLTAGPTEEEAAIIASHFEYLSDLARRGVLFLAGRTLTSGPESFGIAIFNAETDEEAATLMRADPAVIGGVMRAEFFPYRVAILNKDAAEEPEL